MKPAINPNKNDFKFLVENVSDAHVTPDEYYEPDFSKCIDPEFARINYQYMQMALNRVRKNPFIKV